ncbi:MAG: hypothetical protein J6S91_01930, partial [Treponema sp.]|nr:hypothetical protein [Treponema sp.]
KILFQTIVLISTHEKHRVFTFFCESKKCEPREQVKTLRASVSLRREQIKTLRASGSLRRDKSTKVFYNASSYGGAVDRELRAFLKFVAENQAKACDANW